MTDRSHYFKISPTTKIDVYRVLHLFAVSDPCIQHAIKKLLAAGKRGAKDTAKDVGEAIESLIRWQEMREEDAQAEPDQKIKSVQSIAEAVSRAHVERAEEKLREALRRSTF